MATSEVQAVVLAALDDVVATGSDSQVLALRDALMDLERTGLPVVIWSERTRAEIELLRERIGATAPFISEDGSALFVPSPHVHFPVEANRTVAGYGIVEFGLRYDQVVAVLSRVAQSVGIRVNPAHGDDDRRRGQAVAHLARRGATRQAAGIRGALSHRGRETAEQRVTCGAKRRAPQGRASTERTSW